MLKKVQAALTKSAPLIMESAQKTHVPSNEPVGTRRTGGHTLLSGASAYAQAQAQAGNRAPGTLFSSQPAVLPPMRSSRAGVPRFVEIAEKMSVGAADALNDPENVDYMGYISHADSYALGDKSASSIHARYAREIREGDASYLKQIGIAPRFGDYLPQGLRTIMQGWTGKANIDDNAFGYNFDYIKLNSTLGSDRLDADPGSMPKEDRFLCRAALSAQLGIALCMFENEARGGGDVITRHRRLGYLNPGDPRAASQMAQLHQGLPVGAEVVTACSANEALMASPSASAGSVIMRFPPALRPAPMSVSQVFAHEQEAMLSCARLVPRRMVAPDVFEVDVKMDPEALARCIDRCVAFSVLTPHQAQELKAKLADEPGIGV